MNKQQIEITDNNNHITSRMDLLDGQMSFFAELIDQMERYPEVSGLYVENGIIQKKLNAIYEMFQYQIKEVREAQKKIEGGVNEETDD